MPYPEEHSARISEPGTFEEKSYRRKNISKGIDIIMAKKKGSDSMETQAYRFDKNNFTPEQAKDWLKENNIKYISFEKAENENEKKDQLGEINTISGDNIEIAEKLKSGEISGPVITSNCILINLRITGTGETPRIYKNQSIIFNRPIGTFLSDKFLQMCNGLPIAWYHPDDGELDYDNWQKYIIGTIIMPYIKGQEVWGIAKIFDLTKLDLIYKGVASTSPFVNSKNIPIKDGKIEEELFNINHVAIVPAGHWDQVEKEPAIKLGDIIFKKEMILNESEKKDLSKQNKKELENKNDSVVNYGQLNKKGDLNMADEIKKEEPKKDDDKKDELPPMPPKKDDDKKDDKKDENVTPKAGDKKDDDKKDDDKKDEPDKKDDKCDEPDKKDDDKKDDADEPLKGIEKKIDSMMTRLDDKKDQVNVSGELAELKSLINTLIAAEKKEGTKLKEIGEGHEELVTADDDEKEELVNAVSELADSAHADIKIKRPFPKKYETKFDYVRRVLSLNKDLVQDKYHCLTDKIDAKNFVLAKDAVNCLINDVHAKTREFQVKSKGAVVKIMTSDGAVTDLNYGRK